MKQAPMTIVFACVHNAGRSQIAAAFLNHLANPEKARALSAGTRPASRVHPEVVAAMREAGIDLAGAMPRLMSAELGAGAQWVITMGCDEECPVVPGARRDDWAVADPKGKSIEEVRAIRDEIRNRVVAFVDAHDLR